MISRPIPDDLLPWVYEQLEESAPEGAALEWVAGDASNRRYFRLETAATSYMVAQAPPETEKNREFGLIQGLLSSAGVRVPHLYAVDLKRGYLLQEDLGDHMLLPALDNVTVDGHYRRAFDLLFAMAGADLARSDLGAYDLALLSEELSRFDQWFVAGLLGYTLDADGRERIDDLNRLLVDSALEQPRVLVHRDFHSRNLMLLPGQELALIDFQDAVIGPVTYDLVSLLRDCYIRWPREQVRDWALEYHDALVDRGLMARVDTAVFIRWFDWMGLERHIKVLGTFARLSLRDGKAAYLQDLPLVLRYVREVLQDYAEDEPVFARYLEWFESQLTPLIDSQPWSKAP